VQHRSAAFEIAISEAVHGRIGEVVANRGSVGPSVVGRNPGFSKSEYVCADRSVGFALLQTEHNFPVFSGVVLA